MTEKNSPYANIDREYVQKYMDHSKYSKEFAEKMPGPDYAKGYLAGWAGIPGDMLNAITAWAVSGIPDPTLRQQTKDALSVKGTEDIGGHLLRQIVEQIPREDHVKGPAFRSAEFTKRRQPSLDGRVLRIGLGGLAAEDVDDLNGAGGRGKERDIVADGGAEIDHPARPVRRQRGEDRLHTGRATAHDRRLRDLLLDLLGFLRQLDPGTTPRQLHQVVIMR